MQAAIDKVLDATAPECQPDTVEAFVKWLVATGSHFAGNQVAQSSVKHEFEEAKQLRGLLAPSQWGTLQSKDLKQQAQQAKDAFSQLQEKMRIYTQRIEDARAAYTAMLPAMCAALREEVSNCAEAFTDALCRLRTQSPFVQPHAAASDVLQQLQALQSDTRSLSATGSELAKARELVQVCARTTSWVLLLEVPLKNALVNLSALAGPADPSV